MAREERNGGWSNLIYDLFVWTFSLIVGLFFREIHPRSAWRIPTSGPILFVAAPHANQFVDPLIMMRTVRQEARRRISFLIAEKSMKRRWIGFFARLAGSVPVGRALDLVKPARGRLYLPDPNYAPCLVRGVGTDFEDPAFEVGGLLVLPKVGKTAASATIAEVRGKDEILLKKPFEGLTAVRQLTGRDEVGKDGRVEGGLKDGFEGCAFSVAPRVSHEKMYQAVTEKLERGGCVGIFPEGGSHDRTELLPLKGGVAIMALEALSKNPNCGVRIVCCGMNYFHPHKFRSRAVIEFAKPFEVDPKLVELYKTGDRRTAVNKVIDNIYEVLEMVTIQAPDPDTLMLIQAVRRLYNSKGKKLPLPMVIELNRRLVQGYKRYRDDPRVVRLRQSVVAYHKKLNLLNIRDHQVEYARYSRLRVAETLLFRVAKLLFLSVGVLPGTILFSPVFITGKIISTIKSKEALAASTVKIEGRDVIATWKLLVSMAFAPALYILYSLLLAYWTYRDRVAGYMPDWVPLWLVVAAGYVVIFPGITYAALICGEQGMDILKSLRPLFLALDPRPSSSGQFAKLRDERERLKHEVTDLINELGPEMYPDFDAARIIADPSFYATHDDRYGPLPMTGTLPAGAPRSPGPGPGRHSRTPSGALLSPGTPGTPGSPPAPTPARAGLVSHVALQGGHGRIHRNESYRDLASVGVFSSHPPTPTRIRSRSNSGEGTAGAASGAAPPARDAAKERDMDEVARRIREGMRERGRRRRSTAGSAASGDAGAGADADAWDVASSRSSGAATPGSEGGGGGGGLVREDWVVVVDGEKGWEV
ncbi:hypothetical protein BDY21DRAFT_406632 [Lineolata rhizophorae]|uniref:Phospholipid/glycerol acyltransferase domain-containing protein n=1 Tax=Lineolata rhizophorae TaxID=578093 RepID=A0A6A6PA46_9PEZI|nr:hypothetical protein BDY21DRAFT_406632 [Lineolata rhizophorae]